MESNYAKGLRLSKDDKRDQEINAQVEEASLKFDSDILASKTALQQKRRELESLKRTFPVNPKAMVNAMGDIQALEDGIKALEQLKVELFG